LTENDTLQQRRYSFQQPKVTDMHESDNGNIEFVPKKLGKSKRRSKDGNQQSIIALDQNCTHFGHTSTQNEKILHADGLYRRQQHRRRLLFRDIKAVATKKFVDKTQGITHFDILKLMDDPSYTPRQAKNVLRNLKNKGKLYTSRRRKPQEYYLSQEDADYAAQENRRSMHNDPSGVGVGSRLVRKYPTTLPSLDSCNNKDYPDLEYYKAQNVASVIYYTTSGSGAILVGMHKLHLHLTIGGGNHSLIEEAYHERLAHIPANQKNNKEKLVERRIDNYLVRCSFFPSGAVDIYIPCSDHPFPIYMYDPDHTAINIIGFISQIRQFISSPECLNDIRGELVPRIQDPAWQLVDADLNFDVPITTLKFKIMRHFQIVKFGEVFRIYRKLLDGQPYARVEQDKVFKAPLSNKEELGPILVSAAKLVPQKLFDITTMNDA
jgi:Rieske Fe-S protein